MEQQHVKEYCLQIGLYQILTNNTQSQSIKVKNRRGNSIEPWGTLQVIALFTEVKHPFTTIYF